MVEKEKLQRTIFIPLDEERTVATVAPEAKRDTTQVICKFAVGSITLTPLVYAKQNGTEVSIARNVSLFPVSGGLFGAATPSGKIELLIRNQEAAEFFEDALQQMVQNGRAEEIEVIFRKATP